MVVEEVATLLANLHCHEAQDEQQRALPTTRSLAKAPPPPHTPRQQRKTDEGKAQENKADQDVRKLLVIRLLLRRPRAFLPLARLRGAHLGDGCRECFLKWRSSHWPVTLSYVF